MAPTPAQIWQPDPPADPTAVRLVLISECTAADPLDNYGTGSFRHSAFDTTTLAAFSLAGFRADSITELSQCGIYLTTVLRQPKSTARVPAAQIATAARRLESELADLSQVRAWLLMGDVAIAAANCISRNQTGRRAIPAGSTYRLRASEYHLGEVRLFPSYLQAGSAWYIEASKRVMIGQDIAAALAVAGIQD